MTLMISPKMAEVSRLTRAGRLSEAVALLQGKSRGEDIAAERAGRHGDEATLLDSSPHEQSHPQARQDDRGKDGIPEALSRQRLFGGLGAVLEQFERAGLCETTLHHPAMRRFPIVPPALPPGAAFDEYIYACDAGTRPYKLFVPSSYVGQPLPLVVMLHGCKQSPDDFAAGTQLNELAESQGFLVVYPGQVTSANPSKCWNWFNQTDQFRGGGEPALIEGITRRVMQNLVVDPKRVYVAGLSAGGAMAVIMGSEYPELYAAVCVHSGLARGVAKDIPSAFTAMRQGGTSAGRPASRPVPTIVFHGDGDTTVHPENGRQVIAQSKAASELHATISQGRVPSGREYTRTVETDATGRIVLEHWSLHGAGHAWSGGSPNGSYTDASGPNASREMMRFFLLHKRE